MTKWMNKLEYKFRRFGIYNLMIYITGTMLAVYLAENLTRLPISSALSLNMNMVFSGQVWRLVTFVFVPPNNMILWVFVTLYFYYFIGTSLENAWGSSKFTLFYLFGVVGAIIAALISGYGDNMYLNLSLFLAFAATYPDQELLLFFVLPIKVKYLAYVDLAILLLSFISGSWTVKAAIAFSLLNLLLFFGDDIFRKAHDFIKYGKQRRNFRKSVKRNKDMYGR